MDTNLTSSGRVTSRGGAPPAGRVSFRLMVRAAGRPSSLRSRSGTSGTRQQYSRYSAAQASTTAAASVIAAVSASWRGTEAFSEPLR